MAGHDVGAERSCDVVELLGYESGYCAVIHRHDVILQKSEVLVATKSPMVTR